MTGLVLALFVVVLVLVVGGFVALFALLFRSASRQQARRASEQSGYGAARGFGYVETDRALPDRFTGIPFGRGGARTAHHVLQGVHDGRPVIAFEYTFSTHSGERTRHHRYGVVATALPTAVPKLEILRSSTSGTFLDAFRGGDHEIGDPAFDAAYRVFTDSPPFAADVLAPDLRAWLLAQRPPLVYLRGSDLVVVERGAQTPAETDRRLAFAAAFLDLVPDHVWRRAAGGLPG